MKPSLQEKYWQTRARRLVWGINVGWWLAKFAPLAFAVTLAGIPPLLWLRGMYPHYHAFWMAWPALLMAAGMIAAWQAREKFEKTSDGLARLDHSLGLNNRLVSACAGVGRWPEPLIDSHSVLRWRLGRSGGLLISSVLLLVLAATVPVSFQAEETRKAVSEIPPPLADVRTWTRQLEDERVFDAKALEELDQKVDALLRQPRDDWYRAGMLEAAGHLREQTAQTLQNLDRDLQAMENAVAQAQAFREHLPEALAEALDRSLAEAIQGLDLSSLPLNAQQRESLRQLDMKSLTAGMTPEQLKNLRDTLRNNRSALAKNGALQNARNRNGNQNDGKRITGDLIPAILFEQTGKTPNERLLSLLAPASPSLINRHFKPATNEELERVQEASREGRVVLYLEDGIDRDQPAPGIVLLPDSGREADEDDAVVELLARMINANDQVDGAAAAAPAPLTTEQRYAVIRMLRAERLRLGSFSIKPSQGECGACEAGANGAMMVTVSMAGQGRGGPGGGGGPAVLTYNRPPQNLSVTRQEELATNDRSHDTLGDLQGVGTGKHEVDQSAYQGALSGGALVSPGEGGEAVWTDNLAPEERAVLMEYFK